MSKYFPPKTLMVDDIINFEYKGKYYSGWVHKIEDGTALIRTTNNEKLVKIRMHLNPRTFTSTKVIVQDRKGWDHEDIIDQPSNEIKSS